MNADWEAGYQAAIDSKLDELDRLRELLVSYMDGDLEKQNQRTLKLNNSPPARTRADLIEDNARLREAIRKHELAFCFGRGQDIHHAQACNNELWKTLEQ